MEHASLHGYRLDEVISAVQKGIRRGEADCALGALSAVAGSDSLITGAGLGQRSRGTVR